MKEKYEYKYHEVNFGSFRTDDANTEEFLISSNSIFVVYSWQLLFKSDLYCTNVQITNQYCPILNIKS